MPANHKLYVMLIFLPKVSVSMKHQMHIGTHGQEKGKRHEGNFLYSALP